MLINLLYSSIVISGRLVPVFQDGEDIIAITLIFQSKRLKMREAGMWINIHITPHDSHIYSVARQMKKENIFVFVESSLGARTKVRVKKDQEDHIINTVAELQKFTTKPISYFEEKRGVPLDDSGVMDTE